MNTIHVGGPTYPPTIQKHIPVDCLQTSMSVGVIRVCVAEDTVSTQRAATSVSVPRAMNSVQTVKHVKVSGTLSRCSFAQLRQACFLCRWNKLPITLKSTTAPFRKKCSRCFLSKCIATVNLWQLLAVLCMCKGQPRTAKDCS